MIRVVVAEDQGMLLGALCALLSLEDDIEVVGRGSDGAAALQLAIAEQPDVLITDIEMPALTGLELAQKLAVEVPDCKVMVLTTFARSGYFQRAMDAGVKAYLLKDSPSEELINAIRRVVVGRRVIAPELAAENPSDSDPLTDRERQCLRLAGEGMRTGEIAERLFLSAGTVRNYLSEAIGKLHARNRIEAARVARQKGWL
jgi:two-component system response regulator DesR